MHCTTSVYYSAAKYFGRTCIGVGEFKEEKKKKKKNQYITLKYIFTKKSLK
jgi:hypothetical protein